MRYGRTINLIALLAVLAAGSTMAPAASADSGIATGAEASTAAATTESKPTADSSTDAKPTTATEAKPATDTSAPPATEPATTSAPATTEAPSTPVTSTPEAPEAVPATRPVSPSVPNEVPGEAPAPGGGAELPFTGPGDVVFAIVLALLAGTGGILFMAGAAGREQIEGLSRRTMGSPSGFKLAYRELLKQQVND